MPRPEADAPGRPEPDDTFTAAWLELREPVDHRSRAAALLEPLRRWWIDAGSERVVDLGSGTGSNLRYLAPRLPGRQAWALIDRDAELLARAEAPRLDVEVTRLAADLAEDGLAAVASARLVTASALIDLVGPEWLAELADACAAAGAAALFALTYDGTIAWSRRDEDDDFVRDLLNDHQQRDKGLGPALGPFGGRAAEEAFQRVGYRTRVEASPWRLGPEDAGLAREFVVGCARAAREQRPAEAVRVSAWAERRAADISLGDVAVTVGHVDLLALPESPVSPR